MAENTAGGLLDLDKRALGVVPGPRAGMEGVGGQWGFKTTRTLGKVVRPHLGAVRAQVGVGVLEPGDGTVTQAPSDCHQCVEILQLVETLGRESDA